MMSLRVLIVDDNRDGADSLGLLVEELGHQTHVTYGGRQALEVAVVFRPDLMFVDLAMPDLDGCSLVKRFRQMPAFARTRIVAVTGHADDGHKTLAMKSGCDAVLFKPVAPTGIKEALASVAPAAAEAAPATRDLETGVPSEGVASVGVVSAGVASVGVVNAGVANAGRRLPIGEARRIRQERNSKALTESECEAAICEGIIRFQEEYLGWRSVRIHAHFVKDMLVVRIHGVLTLAEQQLGKTSAPEKGRDLIKQVRNQLLELARPMLESLVHEVAGVKVTSMHHDLSTVTGEEVVVFSLADSPRFA